MSEPLRFEPNAPETRRVAAERLGAEADDVVLLGTGETFLCFGSGNRALLVPRVADSDAADKVIVTKVCSDAARAVGVCTPHVIDMGVEPFPHAIVERADGSPARDTGPDRAALYELLGQQLALLHQAATNGAGHVRPVMTGVEGLHPSWREHCADFVTRYLGAEPTEVGAQKLRAIVDLETSHWDALTRMVLDHGRQTSVVLCHYDNRLPNLPMRNNAVWVLDWDLARIAPLSHELIKVFERPPAEATLDSRALLSGYGLPPERHDDIISDALIAMSMDALWLTSQWVDTPQATPAIRGWFSAVKNIVESEARVLW